MIIRALLLCCCFVFISPPSFASGEYRLGPGDVINISVFEEPDLTMSDVLVPANGRISYPFLDDLQLTGFTLDGVARLISDGLRGDYLINPRVTVSLASYRDFFVNGQITRPGHYPYQPGLTVRKAISIGGGFNDRAEENDIVIIREVNGEKKSIRVTLDVSVQPGDILTIGESFF